MDRATSAWRRRALAVVAWAVSALGASPGAALPACLEAGADCALREVAALAGVKIGAAAVPRLLEDDPLYGPALARDFDSVTAENAMKWDALQPAPGRYEFGAADDLVAFAEAGGMAVRGHTLIWDQETIDSTPAYVTGTEDPGELRALLEDHIRTVVGHFRGRVDAWDVVNEPFETFSGRLYGNVFLEKLGPDYIADAFRIAHEADPDAKLFLNETQIGFSTAKAAAVLAFVKDLLADGVPIHGVGFQMHVPFAPDPIPGEFVREKLQAFADLGLVVELTELDVGIRNQEDELEVQGQHYFDLVAACVRVETCERVTTWGFTDRYTWYDSFFGPDRQPLLLDVDFERKPAWFGVRDALALRAIPEPGSGLLLGVGLALATGFSRASRFRLGAEGRRGGARARG
jgi:endo-1,4-beta-xylanase